MVCRSTTQERIMIDAWVQAHETRKQVTHVKATSTTVDDTHNNIASSDTATVTAPATASALAPTTVTSTDTSTSTIPSPPTLSFDTEYMRLYRLADERLEFRDVGEVMQRALDDGTTQEMGRLITTFNSFVEQTARGRHNQCTQRYRDTSA